MIIRAIVKLNESTIEEQERELGILRRANITLKGKEQKAIADLRSLKKESHEGSESFQIQISTYEEKITALEEECTLLRSGAIELQVLQEVHKVNDRCPIITSISTHRSCSDFHLKGAGEMAHVRILSFSNIFSILLLRSPPSPSKNFIEFRTYKRNCNLRMSCWLSKITRLKTCLMRSMHYKIE